MEFRAKNLCINTIAVPGTLAGLRKAQAMICGMMLARNMSQSQEANEIASLLASASVPSMLACMSSTPAEQTIVEMPQSLCDRQQRTRRAAVQH